MIRLSKTKTLDNYFIDDNGIITDEVGNIQKTRLQYGRPYFKSAGVHQIQIYTKYGYKDGYVVHHLDEDITNNSLSNLVYITRNEHMSIHRKGKHLSEETKNKLSEINKNKLNTFYGKHLSEETKLKMSIAHKGKAPWNKGKKMSDETIKKMRKSFKGHGNGMYGKRYKWVNNGLEQKYIPLDEEIPEGFKRGMLKK